MEEKREFETSNGKFWLVKTANNSTEFELFNAEIDSIEEYDTHIETNGDDRVLYFKGFRDELKIIGLISELTEEQCQEVVDYRQRIFFYPDYTHFIQPNYFYSFAISSFKSLCESLDIDLTQNWLLIKLI